MTIMNYSLLFHSILDSNLAITEKYGDSVAKCLTTDCLTRRLWYRWISIDTTRRSLILMGKYGLSSGVACCMLAGMELRYFMFGENNLITKAHTRSFSKKLNSGC
jgi:hypothetical protein